MHKVVHRYFCIVVTISLIFSSIIYAFTTASAIRQTTLQEMLYFAKLVDYQLEYEDNINSQILDINPITYSDDSRITVVDFNGVVLGDTANGNFENHLNREEIIDAIANGYGYSIRYSNTMNKEMMYAAFNTGDFIIRLAIPSSGVLSFMDILFLPILLSAFGSLFLSIIASHALSKKLAKPVIEISEEINAMDFKRPIVFKSYSYSEYNIVTNALNKQTTMISEIRNSLNVEKQKINGILDRIHEGFILLDDNLEIVLVNHKANEIFACDMLLGNSIHDYVFHIDLDTLLKNPLDSEKIVDIKFDKLIYACFVNKVHLGVTILLVDVTMDRNATKNRQEFLSNVSHELKTPLTSIKGYSELLNSDMLTNDIDKKNALHKIHKQVENMSTLINDILTISRLESKDIVEDIQMINLKVLIEDIIDGLYLSVDSKKITVEIDCTIENYMSNYKYMYQLFNNLISNAIKYNKTNGTVKIELYDESNQFIIKVSDSGVGIPLDSRQRVFERFYRVDKGRDKESGGTGLGLAIVKHIVNFYNGKIDLKSEIDVGTTITVYLPL